MEAERVILGIDPGTNIMGYGIIKGTGGKLTLLGMGVIKLGKYRDHFTRLQKIFDRVISLIDEFCPDELAIEAPFFGKNVQSMLKLGRAQGVAISAALSRSIPVFEYAPRKIKMSITGQGNASKEQVAAYLRSSMALEKLCDDLDATDGLAAAVCHLYQNQSLDTGKSYSNWNDFLKKNTHRVKK